VWKFKCHLNINTIAKNRANTAIIHTASFVKHPLSDSSILSFVSNTIVENQAPTAYKDEWINH
jgi:hypothetical protein